MRRRRCDTYAAVSELDTCALSARLSSGMWMIASRTGIGKTAFALDIAASSARKTAYLVAGADARQIVQAVAARGVSERIDVVDKDELDVETVCAVAADGRYDLIVVDYVQAMPMFGDPFRARNTMRTLKTIASKADVPIIILSQLLRRADRRRGREPRLSDIRFSKLIVPFADAVWMLWQDPCTASGTMAKAVLQRNPYDFFVRCALIFD